MHDININLFLNPETFAEMADDYSLENPTENASHDLRFPDGQYTYAVETILNMLLLQSKFSNIETDETDDLEFFSTMHEYDELIEEVHYHRIGHIQVYDFGPYLEKHAYVVTIRLDNIYMTLAKPIIDVLSWVSNQPWFMRWSTDQVFKLKEVNHEEVGKE